jgi:hypothetical protein
MARLRALETPWGILATTQALSAAVVPLTPRGLAPLQATGSSAPSLLAGPSQLHMRGLPVTAEEAATMARLQGQEVPWGLLAAATSSSDPCSGNALLPLAWPRRPVTATEAACMARLRDQEAPWRQLAEAQAAGAVGVEQGQSSEPCAGGAPLAGAWLPYRPKPLSPDEVVEMGRLQRLETPWMSGSGAGHTGCGDG